MIKLLIHPIQIICFLLSSIFFLNASANNHILSDDNKLSNEIMSYYKEFPEYFDFDLQKYRLRSSNKIGIGLRTGLPIGIGAAVFSLMENPIAFVPITMGIVTGGVAIKKVIENKNTKKVLKGAYIYLNPDYPVKESKRSKYTKSFDIFFDKIKDYPEVTTKEQMALKLLYINHFSQLIAKRLQNDPEFGTFENLYKKVDIPNNGQWNQKFMYKYFNLLDKAFIDLASYNSFIHLNNIKYGIIGH